MDENCIFCLIASGSMGAPIIAENAHAIAFDDIAPSAPVHMLVVSKQHVGSLRDLDDPAVAADMLALASSVADARGLFDGGYRVVTNDGEQAGQTVFHLHFHVLGGERLGRMS